MGRPINLKSEAYAQYVIEKASDITGFPVSSIVSQSRIRDVSMARHAITFSLKSALGFSYIQAATVLNRTNHTTARHSYEFVLGQMSMTNRSDDMEFMVELTQKLIKYIENDLSKINPMTDRRRREMGAAMRGQRCHYMSVVGILADGKLLNQNQ